jgi:hypothetical protein
LEFDSALAQQFIVVVENFRWRGISRPPRRFASAGFASIYQDVGSPIMRAVTHV